VLARSRVPFALSGAMAVMAAVSSVLSLFVPSLLLGAEVTNGAVRGTALVVLVVALPVLVTGMLRTAAGSARGLVAWLGAAAYLLYQAVLFCFATPLNRLFLAYVAWLGLAIWNLITLLRTVDAAAFVARAGARTPVRVGAYFIATCGVLNAAAWFARIVPAAFTGEPGSALAGSGLDTSAVWVQDLAFWIPATILVAVMALRHSALGVLLTGAALCQLVIEGLSVASDQWWGARADASYPDIASASLVWPFVGLAALTALPLLAYLRGIDRTTRDRTTRDRTTRDRTTRDRTTR
jgi:hypothetical protein